MPERTIAGIRKRLGKGKVALRVRKSAGRARSRLVMNIRRFILYISIILHLLIGHAVCMFLRLNHGLSFLNANSIVRYRKLDFCYISVKCCRLRPLQGNRRAVIVKEKSGSAGDSAPFPEDSAETPSHPRVSSLSTWVASLLSSLTK